MVSVIMPTYNRESKIKRAINSVLDQTYSDLELIVVDDGSVDNTEEIVRDIKDERIQYIKHTSNMGACAARNTGIEAAIGEYIAFQDSDDVWHSDKLERQINTIQFNNADVVFCKRNMIKNNKVHRDIQMHKEGFLNKKDSVLKIGTQVIFGRAEVFKEIQFDERMPRLQDCEILYRIHKKYTIYCEDKVMVDYYDSKDAIGTYPLKLLHASQLFLDIHPELVKDSKKMAYEIANELISSVRLFDKNDREVRESIYRLAFKYSVGIKIIIKYLLLSHNITWRKNSKGYIVLGKLK